MSVAKARRKNASLAPSLAKDALNTSRGLLELVGKPFYLLLFGILSLLFLLGRLGVSLLAVKVKVPPLPSLKLPRLKPVFYIPVIIFILFCVYQNFVRIKSYEDAKRSGEN